MVYSRFLLKTLTEMMWQKALWLLLFIWCVYDHLHPYDSLFSVSICFIVAAGSLHKKIL